MKPLASRDLFDIHIIESPRISPDGESILFVDKKLDQEKNDYQKSLALVRWSQAVADPLLLTSGSKDSEPHFSPDGERIVFVRKVGDDSNLFLISKDGGEPEQLTHCKNNLTAPAWSPDGKKIAFTSYVTERGLIPDDEKTEDDPYKKYNEDVKIIDRILYKIDGTGFVHNKRSQLFILDLETKNVTPLTFGEHDAKDPNFSPDGKTIVFSSNRDLDSDYEPFSHIYSIPAEGGEPKNLTPGDYYFSNPKFSPDGKSIAFMGTDEPFNWYSNYKLWIKSGDRLECLTAEIDYPVSNLTIDDIRDLSHGESPDWSKDGKIVYISMSRNGSNFLFSIDRETKKIHEYGFAEAALFAWAIDPGSNHAVLGKTDPFVPNDLWALDLANGKTRRITEINKTFARPLSKPEQFAATSKDGTLIEGWIIKPIGFEEGKKYPAILEIHGGPMNLYSWNFFFEFQLLANHGFVVFYSNPRGSMGYGQKFSEAIKGDWGNLDYKDLTAVLEAALKSGFIDKTRLGVGGGSYGGFMTNWIIGHTNRFKAAVTMRSVTNEFSMFGTSDYGYTAEQNIGFLPWENREAYFKMSPIKYVDKMETPLLILHSEDDYRCPMEQAEQLYTALKKRKQEVRFIRFPGESHDLSRTGKPWHRVYRLKKILEWFKNHLTSSS